jgi:hypothetical protein
VTVQRLEKVMPDGALLVGALSHVLGSRTHYA